MNLLLVVVAMLPERMALAELVLVVVVVVLEEIVLALLMAKLGSLMVERTLSVSRLLLVLEFVVLLVDLTLVLLNEEKILVVSEEYGTLQAVADLRSVRYVHSYCPLSTYQPLERSLLARIALD